MEMDLKKRPPRSLIPRRFNGEIVGRPSAEHFDRTLKLLLINKARCWDRGHSWDFSLRPKECSFYFVALTKCS